MQKGGWVYILTNRPNGVLYIGVTSNLPRRMWEHREGFFTGFSKVHDVKKLVYVETYSTIDEAIAREKAMKKWNRAWKVKRILQSNPEWEDLYDRLI